MNYAPAIERYQESLLRIVTELFTLIGLAEGGIVEKLSWPLYRKALATLRPAESAVRSPAMGRRPPQSDT